MNIRTIDSSISSKGAREVLLDEKGDVRILPYSAWASLHWDEVRLMMHEIGLYVAPTEELIDYLDKLIGDNTAIEVGCGLGCVGRELSIPITDSCAQADKDVKAYYSMFGQPTIVYPHDVIRMDAVKAARHFRPHTIIGCYVTHRWRYDTMDGSGNSAQIGSSGYYAQIGSSGDYAQIESTGECSVICCAGVNSMAKAKVGSWITLSEWKYNKDKERYVPVCVKTEYVDGERIKADTWYKLVNGEFKEDYEKTNRTKNT